MLKTVTAYGPLCVRPSPSVPIGHVNPAALLFLLGERSAAFRQLMLPLLGGTPLRLILYIDELKPGNVLRPDKARTTHVCYFSFAEIPLRAAVKAETWWPLAMCRTTELAKVGGPPSPQALRFVSQLGAR